MADDPGDPGDLGRIVDRLRSLVAFPTVSHSPNLQLQAWLGDRLGELGAHVEVVPGAHGRANLVARLGPDVAGGVLFAGHTDVVPPGTGWSTDPWAATVVGDAVHGRGTADMKGFFAALLVALDHVDSEDLAMPVRVVASYDEEIGCVGIRDVLPLLASRPAVAPELVVVGEPTSMRPRHAHLGKHAYRVTVAAAEAHSSGAATHPSAIAEAAELVTVLSAIQRTSPPHADAPPFSLNVGTISGGTQTNVIAGRCEFDFEVRFDSDHDPTALLAPFALACDGATARLADVGGGTSVELLNAYPALRSDHTAGAFAEVVVIADAGPSRDLGFGTEAGLIAAALGCPAMICGPGDIAVAHRPDEFVPLAELARCAAFVSQVIERRCR